MADTLDVAKFDQSSISLTTHLYILEDVKKILTIEDVQKEGVQFQTDLPASESINLSYTSSTFWLKFYINNTSDEVIERILEINHPLIEKLDLYWLIQKKTVKTIHTGYGQPFENRAYKSRIFAFPLKLQAHSQNIIYLQLSSPNAISVPVRLWKTEDFQAKEKINYIFLAGYFGLVIAIAIFSVVLVLTLRERVYYIYFGFILFGSLHVVAYKGLGAEFIWQNYPIITKIGPLSFGAFTSVSQLVFLRKMFYNIRLKLKMDVIYRLLFLQLTFPIILLWNFNLAKYCISIILISMIYVFLFSIYGVIRKERSSYFLCTGISILLFGVVISYFETFSIVSTSFLTSNIISICSAIELIIFTLLLTDRYRYVYMDKMIIDKKLEETNVKLLIEMKAHEKSEKDKMEAEISAKVKSNFLANMSHEIRTPMNAIIGLSQLALNVPPLQQGAYIEKILGASKNLLIILNDILDFSKLESTAIKLEYSYFNIDDVINNINDLFENIAKQKKIQFIVSISTLASRHLMGDAIRLQQVLTNLISNSIKFTQKGKVRLDIAVVHQNNEKITLVFNIIDTGIGINEEQQKLLFQPFSQADTSISRRFGGSGLGLVISQKFVQLMGGEIACQSTPDVGSEFSFTVPFDIAKSAKSADASSPSPPKKTLAQRLAEAAKSLENVRVLLVEDTPLNQQVASEFLRNAKLEVTVADNGQEALALLEHHTFEVILMDIQMPVMDGLEATKNIRENPTLSHLPIIAMSAGVTLDEQEKCQAVGMSDFIPKPINPVQMLEKIKQNLISPSNA